MNIEEARKHIGKEVVLDESTEPYKGPLKETHDFGLNVYGIIEDVNHDYVKVKLKVGNRINIMPHHLKLKQPNYKIRVTEETSAEVQELLFELMYSWADNSNLPKYLKYKFIYTKDEIIHVTNDYGMFIDNPAKGITLPELHKLVLDRKSEYEFKKEIENQEELTEMYRYEQAHNTAQLTATKHGFNHVDDEDMTWQDAYIAMANGQKVQVWIADGDRWETINHHDNWSIGELAQERLRLEPKLPQVKIETPPWEFEDMTWQDAEKSIKEGKNVQVFVCEWTDIGDVFKNHKFRLKTQTVTLKAKPYTKEELLKIVEGME